MRCKGRLKPTSAVLASACSQSASGEAEKVILIAGDRTQQYMAALRPLAEQRGFTLVSILKGGCPLALEGVDEMCHEWNEQLIRHVETLRPAAVFTTTTRILHGIEEVPVPGVNTLVNRLTTAGIGVIGLRDQPRMPFNPIDCVSERSEEQCTVTTRGIFAEEDPNQALARNVRGSGVFVPVDLLPWICPRRPVPPRHRQRVRLPRRRPSDAAVRHHTRPRAGRPAHDGGLAVVTSAGCWRGEYRPECRSGRVVRGVEPRR
ncbi:SGNH hydrolase domain-containing protein [Propioniciclava flava]